MNITKKIFTIIICLVILYGGYSFADNTNECLTNASDMEAFASLIDIVLRLLGWFWIPFATIAGKMMTNSMIYGEFLNLDKTLYMLRNISRTFSNFAVVGIILRNIIEGLMKKELNGNEIMKKVMKLGVGLIIANMSRFLIGATIDISTILTTTVGALPGTYFSADTASKTKLIESGQISQGQKRLTLNTTSKFCDLNNILTSTTTNKPLETEEEVLDKILPKSDSISGPLLYIGASVLKVQDLVNTQTGNNNISDYLMIILIRLAVVVVFFVAILMILVINIFRMVYLWFFIAFSPILAVLYMNGNHNSGESIIDKVLPKFSVGNIIKLIFAPVAMTGLLSILLIVVVLMQQVLQSDNSYLQRGESITMTQGKTIDNTSISTISSPGVFETTMQGNILSNEVSNVFGGMLMTGITIVLLRGIIQAMIKYNEGGIGGETISSIGKAAGTLISNAPILNIGGSKVGVGTARNSVFGRNGMAGDIDRKLREKSGNQEAKVEDMVREMFGEEILPSPSEYSGFTKQANSIVNKTTEVNENEKNSFFDLYRKQILERYQKYKKAYSISEMVGIRDSLPQVFSKLITLAKRNGKLGELPNWKTEDNIESYINTNYKIDSLRPFFDNIYKELGGNPENLKKDKNNAGTIFWKKKVLRSNGTTETTTE